MKRTATIKDKLGRTKTINIDPEIAAKLDEADNLKRNLDLARSWYITIQKF